MVRRVRGRIFASRAGYPRRVLSISSLALVGWNGASGERYGLLLTLALAVVIFAVVVVVPAVWSTKSYRRKAALDVLERLIRWKS